MRYIGQLSRRRIHERRLFNTSMNEFLDLLYFSNSYGFGAFSLERP
jgi:hypothetical protein